MNFKFKIFNWNKLFSAISGSKCTYLVFMFFNFLLIFFFRQFAWVRIHWLLIQPGPTMLFHNQVIILCKFLQLRHPELWEWIRLWCHPITHLVKGQPNQDGPQDFCEITWKNKLLHIMSQILVMNESGIRNPGFGFLDEVPWRNGSKIQQKNGKKSCSTCLNLFFGAYSGYPNIQFRISDLSLILF